MDHRPVPYSSLMDLFWVSLQKAPPRLLLKSKEAEGRGGRGAEAVVGHWNQRLVVGSLVNVLKVFVVPYSPSLVFSLFSILIRIWAQTAVACEQACRIANPVPKGRTPQNRWANLAFSAMAGATFDAHIGEVFAWCMHGALPFGKLLEPLVSPSLKEASKHTSKLPPFQPNQPQNHPSRTHNTTPNLSSNCTTNMILILPHKQFCLPQ